jgi:predicted PilT family ATPase
MFNKIDVKMIQTETTIVGVSRVGECKLGAGAVYSVIKADLDSLNGGKANNTMDALIAEIAVNNGYILLTADFYLSQVAKSHGCNVHYWQT